MSWDNFQIFYSNFTLGTLLGICLGTLINNNLHILITRLCVVAHESISGAEEKYFFRFFSEDLLAVNVDNVGGTILNWLQKENKNSQ